MRSTVRALLARVVAVVLPVLVLTTCTADSPLGVHRSVHALLDARALFQAGGAFPISIDEVEVLVTEVGGGAQVLDTTITAADIQQSAGQITVGLDVPLSQAAEDFDVQVIVRSGSVEYYRAGTTVTVTAGSVTTTSPLTPTYTGPGANADGISFTTDTIVQSGDSALLVATATQGGTAIAGVPVSFTSADSNSVRIRRSPGQAVNRAWAVALASGSGSVTVTATLPNLAGTNGGGTVAYVPKVTQIVLISGDGQTLATSTSSLPLVVEVRDGTGAPFTSGTTVTFARTVGPAGSSVAPLSVVTDGQGRAQTVLTAGTTTGNATVTATALHGAAPLSGSPVTFSATIGTVAGPAANVTANSAVTQTAVVNTAVAAAPSVLVTDANAVPVPGVTVNFTVVAGNGTVVGGTKVTNASGVATVTSWTLPQTVGSNTLTATVAGLTPVTFTATGLAGAPATVAKVSGDAQTGAAAAPLTLPLIVSVKDAFGNNVTGATVNWATTGGGSLAPASGPTGGTGQAQTTWTLGPTAPTQTATATVGALTPASFTATATFGPAPITLGFASIPGVGIGLTAGINLTLGAPAPAGGVTVSLVSGNTNFFTVTPPSVNIAAGQTTGSTVINGVAAGTANLTASATGYSDGTLSVTVQNRNISVPPTLNVPYGQTASLPIQLPAPAPAGGVSFTVVSGSPGNVTVASSPVTIPAGGQTANATLNGILPGPATITVSNPAYLDGITAAATTASLDITQTSVNPNASFGTPITVSFESNNVATAAPAPGITVTFVSRAPACAVATSPVTIPTGLVTIGSTVSYGGAAPGLPCTTYVVATAPNLQPDSVQVTVSPLPTISVGTLTVANGLQDNTSFTLGAANHGGVTVTLSSADPAILLSPNSTTAGTSSITIPVANGTQSVGFYVQALEGRISDTVNATVTVSAPGFSNGTAVMRAIPGWLDLQGLPTTTTTLTPATAFYARLGYGNASGLTVVQNLRAGSPAPPVATFTKPADGFGDLLKKATAPGVTQTAAFTPTLYYTPTDTTSGGVAFRPLATGTTSVSATVPGYIAASTATRAITVSQPTISVGNVTVANGLQDNTSFTLGASNHGGVTVTLSSSDPAILLSPNSTTAGTSSITIPVANGTQSVGFYVQALEGRISDTVVATVTVSAPGFSNGTATMTAIPGWVDLQGLPTTTTSLSPSNVMYARLGYGSAGGLSVVQNLRAGSPAALTASFTTPGGGVGELRKIGSTPGTTQTAPFTPGLYYTPTDSASGGVSFHAIGTGSTTVSVTVPGYTAANTATRSITASQPTISVGALTVASGLQDNTSFTLGASNHGGVTVTLSSSDPAVLLSPNSTTPGANPITIAVPNGTQTVGFYVQALEGRVNDTVAATLTVSAPGFANGTAVETAVPGWVDLQGLPTTTTTLSPSNAIYARLGYGNASGLNVVQNLRAGGPTPPIATFTTPNNGVGELLKKATGASTTQTASFSTGLYYTPTDTTSGGVAFHSLLSGATTVAVTVPGFISASTATRTITASQPSISVGSLTVGSGLQDNTSFTLGAPNHGDMDVTVSSSNPALLISPNATTAGSSSITVHVLDGAQTVGFYMQGLEGQASQVTAAVTVVAPGFTNGTSTGTVVPGAVDLQGVPASTTPFTPSSAMYARLGYAQAGNTALAVVQNLRAGGPGAPVATFTTPANGFGELRKTGSAPGTSQTVSFLAGVYYTPTDSSSGGVVFHPLANGSTTVSVTVPGFTATTAATRAVTVVAPTISVGSLTVGSGLQDNTSFTLSAPNHGGVTVTLTGSDPAILLSPNATTAGQTSITIAVPNGTQTVGFYVQGVEGRTSGLTGSITASAPGFTDGSVSTSVVQAALDLQGVPTTMAVGAPDANVYVRVGTTSGANTSLNTVQTVRAGIPGGGLTVTFNSSNVGAASLLTSSQPAGQSQTVQILAGQSNTPTSVGTGGVGLRRVAAGTSSISGSIPAFITTTNGTDVVTVQ